MKRLAACFAALAALAAGPAQAEIVDSHHGGFASVRTAVVAAEPAAVWDELLRPERWWSHTWSNDSANLSLDPRAGGCFCETLPGADGKPDGGVEHGRVVMIIPHRLLRLSGSLGPLQSEGLAGALTVELAKVEQGTQITWSYVTGGQARFDLEQLAPVVDGVQGEFLDGLAGQLGGDISDD